MALSSKLGHFNLLEEVGQGWLGSVFRAFDPTLNREVAVRVVREDLASNPRFVTDFLREIRVAAGINHPRIVPIYFVGEDRGQYYIVMELLKGCTLHEIIESAGPLDEERALDLTMDIGEVLRAAYRSRLIHGNIKPANIFVTEEDGAKVLDFGLANIGAPNGEAILRKFSYVSPDGVGCESKDFHTDMYSLGATLFHALSGRPPFDAVKLEELALGRAGQRLPLLRELRGDLTPKTEQVVDRMLSQSAHLCYRDYDMLLGDLRDAKLLCFNKGRAGPTKRIKNEVGLADAKSFKIPPHQMRRVGKHESIPAVNRAVRVQKAVNSFWFLYTTLFNNERH